MANTCNNSENILWKYYRGNWVGVKQPFGAPYGYIIIFEAPL